MGGATRDSKSVARNRCVAFFLIRMLHFNWGSVSIAKPFSSATLSIKRSDPRGAGFELTLERVIS